VLYDRVGYFTFTFPRKVCSDLPSDHVRLHHGYSTLCSPSVISCIKDRFPPAFGDVFAKVAGRAYIRLIGVAINGVATVSLEACEDVILAVPILRVVTNLDVGIEEGIDGCCPFAFQAL
jgi:hypothetical protein